MLVESLSVDDLADRRRKLAALLNTLDKSSGGQTEGIRRLRHVAALMVTITEKRNSAEYQSKVLSPSECGVVRHAWQAIQEWAASR